MLIVFDTSLNNISAMKYMLVQSQRGTL